MAVQGTHDLGLVVLSVLIAIAASYTALDLAARLRSAGTRARPVWLATAALAMGGGIWSMHFVAILAFVTPGLAVSYDIGGTVTSLLVAIGVTGFGLHMAARTDVGRSALAAAGIVMGGGIAAMHFIGMAAMRMDATIAHDPFWVATAIAIAVAASIGALRIAQGDHGTESRLAAAVLMGLAIAGMHYAAMRGASFTGHPHAGSPTRAGTDQMRLALGVAAITVLILASALLAAVYDRRFTRLAAREAEALRRSEERFRALYRRTPLPLFSLDPDGVVETVSDGWVRLTGYDAETIAGRAFADLLDDASAARWTGSDLPLLADGGSLKDREAVLMAADGRRLDVLISADPVGPDGGTATRVLGGLVDVTARRRAEEALRQSQKVEAIGQLTGGIAHDFNNLLAVVLGNLELLQRAGGRDPRTQRLIENAIAGVNRGAALTQRMLAFARRQDLRPAPVNAAELVAGMMDLLQRSIGPMVRIETDFPRELPPALVDANQLELALINLAVNARDAMPGGGRILVSAGVETVAGETAGPLAPGRYIRLMLTDTGHGMDAETAARATEPFFTTKGLGKGTGLGLSMVHGLAAQSGGQLVIRSRPGEGTTVEIWLPEASEPSRPAVQPSARVSVDNTVRPAVVLTVDDDPLVLMGTVAMLEDLGHEVVEASSARQALDLVESGRRIDLVLTDQAMPGMTGLQLREALAARWPELPVVVCTGYAELPSSSSGIRKLLKPYGRDALAAAIADCLSEHA